MNTHRIYLTCQLSQGSFSGEAVFEVETVCNGIYVGVAPKRDCFKSNGDPFARSDWPQDSSSVTGKIATRLVANGGNVARVALPDGEAIEVSAALISERESEISHVLV